MIFDNKGHIYSKVEYNNEEEIESVVINNFNKLFGDYSFLLEKSLISTNSGKGTIPDGIIIDFQENTWYILEVELGRHGTWDHIAPQISKQITAMENIETKNKITENCIKQIDKNKLFKDVLSEIDIQEINIHGTINKILQKSPEIAIPIDFIPNDLNDWKKTLKVKVNVWVIEKYKDIEGNLLYNIPDLEIEKDEPSKEDDKFSFDEAYKLAIEKGLLKIGQKLHFEYTARGKNKARFEGIVAQNGIDVNGEIANPRIAALRCIQKVNPKRTSSKGWKKWKTEDEKYIYEIYEKIVKMCQS